MKEDELEIEKEMTDSNNKDFLEENKTEIEEVKEKTDETKEEVNIEKEEVQLKKQSEIKKLEQPKEEKKVNPENKNQKRLSIKLIVFIVLLIISLLVLSTAFAILNINNTNIIAGVYIEDIDLTNLSKEQSLKIINEKIQKIEDIDLKYGEYSTIVKIEDIGIEIDYNDAINKAINLGRTNNIIIDNYQILFANLFEQHFNLNIQINKEKINTLVKNIQAEIPEGIQQYSYDIKDEELVITNGKAGKVINVEILRERIIQNIKSQFNDTLEEVELPIQTAEPEKINIDKIYNEIYKEAKDAYIVEEPFELHKEENGVDFKTTLEEAKAMLKEEKEAYTIPLKITKPKVAVKDLGDKLFKQTLAKYTTIYDAGNKNRSHNIALAAKTINGTILLPGETFSYNGILGNTNKAKGYKVGTAYVGGKVVESYGGGICQLSSTIYNAVLYANLGIVERHNHSYVVNYVPAGRDATVAYGGKDFKFKNTRNYPIKIVSSAKNGVVSVSIMGIKEEKEYDIVLTSTVLSTTPRSVVYEKNSALEEGKQKVIQKGYDGKKSIAYKIVKYNGKTISKTVLSKDTYKPMNQIIQVGTKKKANTGSSTTTQTNTQPSTNNTTNTNTTTNNTSQSNNGIS